MALDNASASANRHVFPRIVELLATCAADLIGSATDCEYPAQRPVTATKDVGEQPIDKPV
jgi:hypothetical protein